MIYLDYAASSPVYREALELMTELMMDNPANPGGLHSAANRSRALLSRSRKTLAALLNVRAEELYFTSGGTERKKTHPPLRRRAQLRHQFRKVHGAAGL